ncbi:glycosyltransferase [Nocardioides panacisoli]|uniref:glycosyltransferase family 2 protein n=1 Tax=Nocardioides panacisoli TaxID=627624 RepID=UPI001C631440|nr:glycosyltransferase [Nocardioides panacisoli]QYJ03736.1 glycosyltransferase [Nocardioides panacisoli]
MSWLSRRRSAPQIGVVVPAYDVAAYLPACLDSLLAQTHRDLDVVVVDDGSPDDSGEIAEQYAARDERVRVLHIDNRGLGGARNEGLRHVRGEWITFADSDDVVPPTAYERLLAQGRRTRADLVTGDVARLVGDEVRTLGWSQRLHDADRRWLRIAERPELLGDVFAWNKLYRREFWDRAGLRWPERIRYEDQPTTTEAFVAAERIGIVPEVVYHWRQREDGTSISQQRASVEDLRDRWTTKRMSLATVAGMGSPEMTQAFLDRVLPGDLWRYFRLIPEADDEWWDLLVAGVREFWGEDRSLVHSTMLPVDRLTGWLVEQGRRDDAALVRRYRATHEGPLPRVPLPDGTVRVDVPGLDHAGVAPEAMALRRGEH